MENPCKNSQLLTDMYTYNAQLMAYSQKSRTMQHIVASSVCFLPLKNARDRLQTTSTSHPSNRTGPIADKNPLRSNPTGPEQAAPRHRGDILGGEVICRHLSRFCRSTAGFCRSFVDLQFRQKNPILQGFWQFLKAGVLQKNCFVELLSIHLSTFVDLLSMRMGHVPQGLLLDWMCECICSTGSTGALGLQLCVSAPHLTSCRSTLLHRSKLEWSGLHSQCFPTLPVPCLDPRTT